MGKMFKGFWLLIFIAAIIPILRVLRKKENHL